MKGYPICIVLWNDPHIVLRDKIPRTKDDLVFGPTLTAGLLVEQNDDFIVIAHTLERDEEGDITDYTTIFNGCVLSIKEYGQIQLEEIKGAS